MKKTKSQSFSRHLSGRIILFTSILIFIIMSTVAIVSYVVLSKEVFKRMETLLDANVSDIEKTLGEVETAVKSTAWMIDEHKNEPEYLYHISRMIIEKNPDIVGSAIAFRRDFYDGVFYFSPFTYRDKDTKEIIQIQLGSRNYDYFHMDWYQIPLLLKKPVWSEPYFDKDGDEQKISTYSYPLIDENGEVYAIVTADLSLDWLTRKVDAIKPYHNSVASLTSRCNSFVTIGDGNVFAGETVYSMLDRLGRKYRNFDRLAELVAKGEKGWCVFSKGWHPSFAVLGPLSNGWMLSMSCDYYEVIAEVVKVILLLALIAVLALVLLFFMCNYTVRKISRPLSEFTEAANTIAQGNFNATLPEMSSGDEVNRLRDSFEYMQKSINDYMEELRVSTASKERMESELSIASGIQQSMLAHDFPDRDDVGIDAFIIPAREVGGDLYDFFIKDGVLYFAVGDVSGKGIPASIFMAITRYSFRFIANLDMSLDKVVSTINKALSEGNENAIFVTLFVGSLDLKSGELKYCNAGHDPLIVAGPSSGPYYLDMKPNLAVGLFEGFPYEMQRTVLEKGTTLVLYTDGVTEAERSDYGQYGTDRLLEWASTVTAEDSAKDVRTNLYNDIKAFTDGNEQNDDLTIMVIKYK